MVAEQVDRERKLKREAAQADALKYKAEMRLEGLRELNPLAKDIAGL